MSEEIIPEVNVSDVVPEVQENAAAEQPVPENSAEKNVENSVVIAGKTYKVSALTKVPSSDKSYTTTTLGGVAINKSTMNLSVGGTDTFKALGTTKKITYSSNNKKVATVTTSGKVTAKGAGIATITMKMGAKTYTVRVRVNK